jgi:hypothetical protein
MTNQHRIKANPEKNRSTHTPVEREYAAKFICSIQLVKVMTVILFLMSHRWHTVTFPNRRRRSLNDSRWATPPLIFVFSVFNHQKQLWLSTMGLMSHVLWMSIHQSKRNLFNLSRGGFSWASVFEFPIRVLTITHQACHAPTCHSLLLLKRAVLMLYRYHMQCSQRVTVLPNMG